MFCKYCGSELKTEGNFCPNCGAEVNKSNIVAVSQTEKEVQTNNRNVGPFKVFAFIGFGVGIESIIISIIPFFGFIGAFTGIIGVIFASLGLKSRMKPFAIIGLVLSCLSVVLGAYMYYYYIVCGNLFG